MICITTEKEINNKLDKFTFMYTKTAKKSSHCREKVAH